jgi:glycosyltransferase involved in cell wall biosynthesis
MVSLRQKGRILYISSVDISLSNGPGVNEREFIFSLYKIFVNRVHFLIPTPKNDVGDISKNGFTFSRSHRQHYLPAYLVHLISQFHLANSLLSSGKFNFIVFRLSDLPLVESCITRRYNKIPYVVKTLGTLDGLRGQNGLREKRGLKGILGKFLAPLSLILFKDIASRSLAIDACTKIFLNYHQKRLSLPQTRFHLIENSTNTDRFRPLGKMKARSLTGLHSYDPIVGYVGGRPWERGGRQLIEITPALVMKYPSLGIVIVGGGNKLGHLEKRAKELGIGKHCVFPGMVPYDRVPDYINSFDIGISLPLKYRSETYGNSSQKVRQYLACGKPVVSGPGGNRFLERENLGSVIDVNDYNQMISAVKFWLSLTNEEKAVFSQRARSYAVENLSVIKALEDRIDFWNERLNFHNYNLQNNRDRN